MTEKCWRGGAAAQITMAEREDVVRVLSGDVASALDAWESRLHDLVTARSNCQESAKSTTYRAAPMPSNADSTMTSAAGR